MRDPGGGVGGRVRVGHAVAQAVPDVDIVGVMGEGVRVCCDVVGAEGYVGREGEDGVHGERGLRGLWMGCGVFLALCHSVEAARRTGANTLVRGGIEEASCGEWLLVDAR